MSAVAVASEALAEQDKLYNIAMVKVCLEVWDIGQWPSDWIKSGFIPLPNKGDLLV